MDGTAPIPPLLASLAATPHVQEQQLASRTRQIRRANNRAKVSSLEDETIERQVESPAAVEAIGDPDEHDRSGGKQSHHRDHIPGPDAAEGEDHLDITA